MRAELPYWDGLHQDIVSEIHDKPCETPQDIKSGGMRRRIKGFIVPELNR